MCGELIEGFGDDDDCGCAGHCESCDGIGRPPATPRVVEGEEPTAEQAELLLRLISEVGPTKGDVRVLIASGYIPVFLKHIKKQGRVRPISEFVAFLGDARMEGPYQK